MAFVYFYGDTKCN